MLFGILAFSLELGAFSLELTRHTTLHTRRKGFGQDLQDEQDCAGLENITRICFGLTALVTGHGFQSVPIKLKRKGAIWAATITSWVIDTTPEEFAISSACALNHFSFA